MIWSVCLVIAAAVIAMAVVVGGLVYRSRHE